MTHSNKTAKFTMFLRKERSIFGVENFNNWVGVCGENKTNNCFLKRSQLRSWATTTSKIQQLSSPATLLIDFFFLEYLNGKRKSGQQMKSFCSTTGQNK